VTSVSAVPLKWQLLASLLPEDASPLLDCGCGDGGLASFLESLGYSVRGVERDPHRVSAAAAKGIDVMVADLSEAAFWRSLSPTYGSIIFSDVLEHLERPQHVLRLAKSALRPGGGVLLSIPNVAYWRIRLNLAKGEWQYEDEGILDRTHRWFFTLETMKQLIEGSGFRLVALRPLPAWSPNIGRAKTVAYDWLARWWPSPFGMGFLAYAR
jgi:methionine biosynthesis protein MetW